MSKRLYKRLGAFLAVCVGVAALLAWVLARFDGSTVEVVVRNGGSARVERVELGLVTEGGGEANGAVQVLSIEAGSERAVHLPVAADANLLVTLVDAAGARVSFLVEEYISWARRRTLRLVVSDGALVDARTGPSWNGPWQESRWRSIEPLVRPADGGPAGPTEGDGSR